MTTRIARKTLRRPLEYQKPHLRERALTQLLGPLKPSGCRGAVHIAGKCACFGVELVAMHARTYLAGWETLNRRPELPEKK